MKIPQMQNDRVLIKRLPEMEETAGGIIIPDVAKEKPMSGTVVNVGPGRVTKTGVRVPIDLQIGDTVLFARYAGLDMKVGGDDFLIVREDEVLGVI